MTPLLAVFPNLATTEFQITSPPDRQYNCIAWAAGDTSQNWWPGRSYWPPGIPAEETVDAFILAFQTLGYTPCADGGLEEEYEKVALYALAGAPKHAARQLPNGKWSSKLGAAVDVEHVLEGVCGDLYGTVVQFMKRPPGSPTPPRG
jgi:hypothetical protein